MFAYLHVAGLVQFYGSTIPYLIGQDRIKMSSDQVIRQGELLQMSI